MPAFFPVVPIERSLDGQVFHTMSEAAALALFNSLEDVGHNTLWLTKQIESGSSIAVNPFTAVRPDEEPLIWLRLAPMGVAHVNVRRNHAGFDPVNIDIEFDRARDAVDIAEAEVKRSLEMIESAKGSVRRALGEGSDDVEH